MTPRGRVVVGVVSAMLVLASVGTATGCSAGRAQRSGGTPGTPSPSTGASGPRVPAVRTRTAERIEPAPGTPLLITAARRRARAAARSAIGRHTAYLGEHGVSVAAVDLRTGASFHYGARGGMTSGSIAKLFILETLLLQHQDAGTVLDEDEVDLATRMIENSDNEAADDLDERIGEGAGMARAARALGVRHTHFGAGIYWGFNETSAPDYLALLRNLVEPHVLHPRARDLVLDLMAHTEADQSWGVSAAADAHTVSRQKNGWLAVGEDGGRWLVNSTGIITAHGHRVLIAVLTQHGDGYDSGVALTERLARITVRALQA